MWQPTAKCENPLFYKVFPQKAGSFHITSPCPLYPLLQPLVFIRVRPLKNKCLLLQPLVFSADYKKGLNEIKSF